MEDDVKQAGADRYAVSQAHRWKAERDAARQELREIQARLMPEGMEWPRFEDGKQVRIGDDFGYGTKLNACEVTSILFTSEGCFIEPDYSWEGGDYMLMVKHGERVKHPAPKVLDTDGVEIRVGDTVWTTRDLDKFTVTNPNNGNFLSVSCKGEDGEDYCCYPTDLTHRAPVLAADGEPLREGETVWSIFAGIECVIKRIDYERKGGEACVCVRFADMESLNWVRPDELTHERPVADTWERIEEDATKLSPYYYARDVMGLDTDKMPSKESRRIDMMRDLVRRAKAIAERDA